MVSGAGPAACNADEDVAGHDDGDHDERSEDLRISQVQGRKDQETDPEPDVGEGDVVEVAPLPGASPCPDLPFSAQEAVHHQRPQPSFACYRAWETDR